MRIIRYIPSSPRAQYPAFARSPWAGLEQQMDRLFESALGETAPLGGAGFPIDLYEDNAATYVRAELPGVSRGDINVELVDGTLHISAKRVRKSARGEETTEFSRAVPVPEGAVQADKISAALENGLLTVTLPKREEAKPKKISVAVA